MFGIFKMRESQIALRLSVCLFKWLAFPPQKSCTFVSFFVFQVGKEMCMPGIASEQDQNICVSMKLDSTTTGRDLETARRDGEELKLDLMSYVLAFRTVTDGHGS